MSNMPILTHNTPPPSKAAAQANPSANSNEANAQDAQGFGGVLARQLSDKADETKAADAPKTNTPPLLTTETAKPENGADATNASLPTDMLATLLPVATAVPQMASTAPNSAVDINAQSELKQLQIATRKGTSTAATDLNYLLGKNSPLPRHTGKTGMEVDSKKDGDSTSSLTLPRGGGGSGDVSTQHLAAIKANEALFQTEATIAQTASPALPALASTNPSPSLTPATQLMIDTAVTQSHWGNEFSQKITWLATQQDQHAELHLNPAQLGPVDVVINVNGDQATAQFTSAHAGVREAIEQSIPKLREMLADNGIMLGNTTVSDQTPREQRGAFDNPRHAAVSSRVLEAPPANMSETRVVTPLRRHNGRVDTFA